MMSTCDMKSKEVRKEMTGRGDCNDLEVKIPNYVKIDQKPDYRAVQEIIRIIDCEKDFRECVTHKFGENVNQVTWLYLYLRKHID